MAGKSPPVIPTSTPEEQSHDDVPGSPPTTADYISSVSRSKTDPQTTCEATPMNSGDALSLEKIHRPDQLKKTTSKRPQRASVGDYVNEDDLSLSAPPWTDRGRFYIGEKQDHDLEKTNYEDAIVEGEDEDASSFLEGEAEDQAIGELVRIVIDKVKADLMNERANTLRALELTTTEPFSTTKPTSDKTFPEAISYTEKELQSKELIKTIGHQQKEVEKLAKTSDTENLYEGDEEIRLLNKEEEDEIGALVNSVLTRAESDVLSERNEVPHYDSERFGDEVDSPDERLTSVERNLLDEVSTSSKDGNSQTEVIVEDTTGDETRSGEDSDFIGDEEKFGLSRDMQNDRQIEASNPEEKDMHKIPQRRAGDKVAAKAEMEKNEASAQNTDELETQRTGVEKHEERVHGGALNFLDGGDGKDEVTGDADEEEELNSMIGFVIDSARSSLVKPADISTASSEESRKVSNDKEIESIDEVEENKTLSAKNGNSLDPLRNIQNGVTVEGIHDDENENRKASGNATLNDSGGDNPNEEQDEAVDIIQPVVDDVKAKCQSSLPVSDVEPPETDTDDKVSSVAKEIMDKIISILTSRTLSDDANVPPAPVKVNGSTDQQSQRVSDTSPCKPTADSPQQNPTSPRPNTTASVIGQQVPLTADDIASDSDSDDDAAVSGSETKSSGVDENDWECLAIRQISKSQSTLVHYGETYHNWYPAYNTAHLGVTDLLKKYKEDACDRVERKLDEMAAKRNKADTISTKPDMKIHQKGKEVNKHLPVNHSGNISKISQHDVKLTPAMLPPEPDLDREAVESGMALINDRLRKKIVALDQQIKKLALNLTFLGDRNWRLEAYIDCLIKTLEVLEVTDVVDLDQKTLPLCLFRVKVKAGYKLSSFNGIPSRSLWSYAKDGRKPPFVDLSGWGDTDKPAESTLDPSFTPTPADDVGLSATQMYEYESQIEELSMQNQILEAQLREANERAEASVTGGDKAELGLQSLHQQQQHADQPQYIQQDALQRQFLQQQLQQLQEYHHEQWREINEQLEQQQQLQQQQMEQQQVLTTVDPSSQPQQQEQQYSVSKIPQQPPQHQLHNHDQLQQQQQQQQHQSFQFQQYKPPILQQQQQLQYQPSALQQTWLPKAVQDDVVISATSGWNPSGQHGLQDPQDWPTLTESQATVDARSFSNSETVTEGSSHSVPTRRPKPLASGTVSDITQPKVTSSPNDKSTLYSSLSLPASTGSIPNNKNRHKVPQDNKPQAHAQSSSSAQSINRGRRFETNYRREPPRSSPGPHQSRSGTETVPRAPRQESFRRYDGWNPSCPSYSGYHEAANRRHHHDNWHPERPVYRNNWHGPSYAQRNGQRDPNYDCTQHLLRLAESGLESVFGTDHVLFFKNQLQREGSRFNDRDFEHGRHSSPQRTHEYNGSSTGSGNHGYPSHGRLYGRRPTTPTRRGDGAWNRGPQRTSSRPTATDEPRNE